ncbi:MAG: LUD domain-containing protein [Thermoleophilia bacterium]|nr:LUD domain-containing protein [Thermoleophilia bacterium]
MSGDLVEMFVREAEAVGSGVSRVSKAGLVDRLAGLVVGDRSVVVAAGLEQVAVELRSRGIAVVCEGAGDEAAQALPSVDAGIGRALAGIAASGTVVVGPGTGLEGLVSTLPPHHVAILSAGAILPDLAAALRETASLIAIPGSRIALVTGPSRTSDIELTPVIGVHGPLRLDVVIVDE